MKLAKFLYVALLVLTFAVSVLAGSWLWKGRAEYLSAWNKTQPNLSITQYSTPLLAIAKAVYDDESIFHQAVRVTISKLETIERVRDGNLAHHIEQFLLLPYMTLFLSAGDAYGLYLGHAYFGQNEKGAPLFGVEESAKAYFNKSASQLSASEAALLMAVGISPTYYDPLKNPGRALQKRNEILQMAVFKHILTPEQGEAEKNSPLGLLEQVK